MIRRPPRSPLFPSPPLSRSEVPAALDYYRHLPNVAYAEPNYRIRLFATPNDPRREALWGLDRINAAQAWDQTTGRSEEHTSELQSRPHLVCRLLLENKQNA